MPPLRCSGKHSDAPHTPAMLAINPTPDSRTCHIREQAYVERDLRRIHVWGGDDLIQTVLKQHQARGPVLDNAPRSGAPIHHAARVRVIP
ncbi:hypothetical protein FIBSPDRAFT_847576 [Athelia psychrophila]|uniref:Uncharacterized protein n=1 Tax=Athelia psychrophila TaxID=1759441 RepID=A0A166WDK4_9AGAM|nr:hypothetical protein FIBSPDRAFT_847576 [Fibularhizoctonia sp. CBS 109695]